MNFHTKNIERQSIATIPHYGPNKNKKAVGAEYLRNFCEMNGNGRSWNLLPWETPRIVIRGMPWYIPPPSSKK
jgi:hypothetical protein